MIDIGGTTSDVGILHQGFPRVKLNDTQLGDVRVNFRMPGIRLCAGC